MSKVTIDALKGRKLGRILTKLGKLSREQVHEAIAIQEQQHAPIGRILIELGYVDEADVNQALAAQAGMETLDLENRDIPEDIIQSIPAETAKAYKVIPLDYDQGSNSLTIVMGSADNFRAVDDLQMLMGFSVKPLVADPEQIEIALAKYYGEDDESIAALVGEMADDSSLMELQDGTAFLNLVNLHLILAI